MLHIADCPQKDVASARHAITLGSFTHNRRPPKIVGVQWVGEDVRSIRVCLGVIDRPVQGK